VGATKNILISLNQATGNLCFVNVQIIIFDYFTERQYTYWQLFHNHPHYKTLAHDVYHRQKRHGCIACIHKQNESVNATRNQQQLLC